MTDNSRDEISRIGEVIDELLRHIERSPKWIRDGVLKELQPLVEMVKDSRNPRVMIMGRRGSGKSSIINALIGSFVRPIGVVKSMTGEARWETCEYAGRQMELLDTRGVQEGSRPEEHDSADSAEESLLIAVRKTCPDVIVFVVKAEDVDAAIDGDLAALETVHAEIISAHGTAPRILPVLNHCDKLYPSDIALAAQDSAKQETIEAAKALLSQHLSKRARLTSHLLADVIPVSAYAIYDPVSREIVSSRDYRWNIELLALKISESLPDAAQLTFTRLARFRRVQRRVADRVVNVCAAGAGVVAAEPIPVADLPVITAVQASMIFVIAYVSGERLEATAVRRFIIGLGANVVGGIVLREVARALIRFLPGAGSVVSAGIAIAGTKAIGRAAIGFYIDRRQIEDVKREFDESQQ